MYHLQTDIELYRNITSIHQRFLAFVTCLTDTMQLLSITLILYLLIIHMKKLLDSDWLRAVQFKCNTSAKSVTPVQNM